MSKEVTKLWQSSAGWRGSEWRVAGTSRDSGDWSLALSQGRRADEGRKRTARLAGVNVAWVDGWRKTLEGAVQLPVAMASHCLTSGPLKH